MNTVTPPRPGVVTGQAVAGDVGIFVARDVEQLEVGKVEIGLVVARSAGDLITGLAERLDMVVRQHLINEFARIGLVEVVERPGAVGVGDGRRIAGREVAAVVQVDEDGDAAKANIA
jgi:hypothetical protein